jgi:tetratricopeptide (TPR) repeat protein
MDFHAGRILSVGSAEKELREQGAKWAEQAVAAAPTLPQCLHVLALAHYRAGKFEQAVQHLKESRKAAPDWGGPLNPLLLALCYQALKQPDEAEVERHNANVWLEKTNLPRPAAEAELPPATLGLADWLEYQLLRREVKRVFAAVNP